VRDSSFQNVGDGPAVKRGCPSGVEDFVDETVFAVGKREQALRNSSEKIERVLGEDE